jgi:hypothetical protein
MAPPAPPEVAPVPGVLPDIPGTAPMPGTVPTLAPCELLVFCEAVVDWFVVARLSLKTAL